jgi:glycerol-3-phosphate dehydrogenase
MNRFIESYKGKEYDVIVIGGGITGAAVAYDAASRGLSVALVEKQDFGCATSAATSKLIHGGFRYLVNFEFRIVRESLRERRILSNIAPNLVYPTRVLVPCYNSGVSKHTTIFRLGMLLYDSLSFDKGRTWDASKRIGPHCTIPLSEALKMEPALPREGIKKVFSYYDCASLFPERLTLAFIRSAVQCGAEVANYCRVEDFLFTGGGSKIAGVRVKDLAGSRDVELKGKLTINCGGPWADLILDAARGHSKGNRIKRSEGIHIITRKPVCHSLIAMVTSTGRGFVMAPWRGYTLIGPTDKEYAGNPDEYRVTKQAVRDLVDTVNQALGGAGRIELADVVHAYGGLRPLVGGDSKSVRDASRKYEIHDSAGDGFEGLITVEGGKYTTSRNLAQNVMKMAAGKLNAGSGKCITGERYLAGCDIKDIEKFIDERKAGNPGFDEKTVDTLCRYYGTDCGRVLELARQDKALADPLNDDGEIAAQAVFAVRHEMALTLKDILLRRTGIGALGDPGAETITKLANVAAMELKWNEAKKAEQIIEARDPFVISD